MCNVMRPAWGLLSVHRLAYQFESLEGLGIKTGHVEPSQTLVMDPSLEICNKSAQVFADMPFS